jgi:DNA polymerase-1
MSPYALGMTIGVKRKEAEELVNGYLNGFPNLKKWMEESKLFAKENGYIKTQVGRIRHLDNLKKIYEVFGDSIMNYDFKKQLEKQYGQVKATRLISQYKNGVNSSMNFQIQSMAASVVNRAAIAINREFQDRGINGWVCAQVHDQLLMEVEESRAKEAAEIVQDKMENTTKLNVPLVAIPQIAKNMRDGH